MIWELIEDFAYANEEFLREHLELPNGIPSHDTIQRVMTIIDPKEMQGVQLAWNETVNSDKGGKLKKILNADGKTMRGVLQAQKRRPCTSCRYIPMKTALVLARPQWMRRKTR